MKVVALILVIILFSGCSSTGKTEDKPYINQKPDLIRQNIEDMKTRLEILERSQEGMLEESIGAREVMDKYMVTLAQAQTLRQVSKNYDIDMEYLMASLREIEGILRK